MIIYIYIYYKYNIYIIKGEEQMKLKNFQEKDLRKQQLMEEKLKGLKLEDIRSMWYFVRSSSGGTIMGSKN